jgi:hydroxymethylpyrimidine pyrophosphatase-like HAD family hydrolase
MANAFPEVKAVCKYQTASNDEDGVALVLEKMLSAIA